MDWNEAYNEIKGLLREFRLKNIEVANAKNKKDRASRATDLDFIMERTKKYIKSNQELCELFAGKPDNDPLGYVSVWDEFKKPSFFDSDMSMLLLDIQSKIDEGESEEE